MSYVPQAHVLQLALDVASGLEHLHSKNVVHADLTPNNVLLQVGWLVSLKQRAAAGWWLVRLKLRAAAGWLVG